MSSYRASDYPPAAVTVDLVVLTIRDDELCALVIRRAEPPFAGHWALPGGFALPDEGLDEAAARELAEETALHLGGVHLEQLGSYGRPDRDPRLRVVTVAYLVLAPNLPAPVAGTDAAEVRWAPISELEDRTDLAFDHSEILRDGVERARAKLEYTSLAAAFCGDEFTVADLRRVYEIVWGASFDPRNFHRKVTSAADFISPTGRTTTRDGGRPAQLYRRGTATLLHPPMLRAGSAEPE